MSEQQHTTPRQYEVPWWVHFCRWLWKCTGFLGTSVILALAVNVVSTWLTTSKGALPDDAPLHLLVVFWPITVSVGCCLLLLAVLFWVISQRATSTSESPLPITPQDRTRLVKRLRLRYEQMLQQSLQGAVQIELGLMSRPTAIQNSALLALRLPEQADQVLPAHTSIVDVYERANQELLILGEPGAGKSTLLLELAHALVAQADQDATSPLPVLLPLSTWVTKQPPLQDWLIEQFALIYDVHRTLSRQWIEAKLVLPLLDGLDEMDEAARPACVVAINTYHREHLSPLVVCSRTSEYEQATLHERLALDTAVVVQPLLSAEVNAYLATLGKPLAALHTAFKKNPTLLELATTPLMLQILILTYTGTTVRQLSQKAPDLQRQIWEAFIERMIEHKGNRARYPLDRTCSWLQFLAQYMRQQNQTIFFLELLQSDALPKPHRNLYRWSIVLVPLLVVGPVVGTVAGLFYGLTSGLFYGLTSGLFVGPVVGLIRWLRTHQESEIQLAEKLSISWERYLYSLLGGLVVGLLFGLLFGLTSGLGGGLNAVLIGGLVVGLESEQFSERQTFTPNEGIKRSFKNGLWSLLFFGLLIGLLYGLINGLLFGLTFELFVWLVFGLFVGLLFGLINGLYAVLQHYTLRFWLWSLRLFPLKAVPFLEDATARILLRRVGGGYKFTHGLLMDYFADLDTTSPVPATETQPGQQSPPW
ncbi:NACHT domain-containing protein [Ktedonobacter racemifer]|nr:NACHT domain-containing protein [Ktedonobacter racemifer]